MKKLFFFLVITSLVVFTSCMDGTPKHNLIGKKGIIEYTGVKASVNYLTETTLHWKTVDGEGNEAEGNEELYYKRFSDELHFLNWIEQDGTTISQVINTKTGDVKTFWSFADEDSDRGGRSSMFLEGRFSFDK